MERSQGKRLAQVVLGSVVWLGIITPSPAEGNPLRRDRGISNAGTVSGPHGRSAPRRRHYAVAFRGSRKQAVPRASAQVGLSMHVGSYHNLNCSSWSVSPEQGTFEWTSWPMGNTSDPNDYAVQCGEPLAQSRAEMPVGIVRFTNVFTGGTVTGTFFKANGVPIYSYSHTIPHPSTYGYGYWAWYAVAAWVGKFPHEISEPGAYYMETQSPWGTARVNFVVTGAIPSATPTRTATQPIRTPTPTTTRTRTPSRTRTATATATRTATVTDNSCFDLPVRNYQASDGCLEFLQRNSSFANKRHAGDDFCAPAGTPVYAPADGRVMYARAHGSCPNWGYLIALEHSLPDGVVVTLMGHVRPVAFLEGTVAKRGDVIGSVAHLINPTTGKACWTDHIHQAVARRSWGAAIGVYPSWVFGYFPTDSSPIAPYVAPPSFFADRLCAH